MIGYSNSYPCSVVNSETVKELSKIGSDEIDPEMARRFFQTTITNHERKRIHEPRTKGTRSKGLGRDDAPRSVSSTAVETTPAAPFCGKSSAESTRV